MKHKFLCALTAAALCISLAACGKSAGSAGTTYTPPEVVTETPAPAEEAAETQAPYEANVLTGEPKGDDYPEGQRITAVMVNNIVQARPQRGLSQADMLVEIKVEGGITRFMPLYVDYNKIGEIGPVRSGRDQFFQLILPWQALYVHEGQSVVMEQYAKDYDYGDLNHNVVGSAKYGYRDEARANWQGLTPANGLAYEHTLYSNSEMIAAYIADTGVDMSRTYNSTFFNFVDYRQENPVRDLANSPDSGYSDKYGPLVTDGNYVEITHSQTYKTRFFYDASSNSYRMQQYYSTDGSWRDTVDEANGETLTFPNVIVLYTQIEAYPAYQEKDLQCVDYSWGGIGYYCYGGKCEKIYWQKGTPMEALRLYYLTEDGQCSDTSLEVNIGKSYLAVTDVDFAESFVASAQEG